MTASKDLVSQIQFFLLLLQLFLLQTPCSTQPQSDPYLLFPNRKFIQRVNLDGSGLEALYEAENELVSNNIALDLNLRTGDVYLSDIGRQKSPLTQFHVDGSFNNTRPPIPLVTEDIGRLETVAWDWIGQKLYWTDTDKKTIEVMDPATGQRRVLMRFYRNNIPRDILLHPQKRIMYWTAWQNQTDGNVFMASMDGQNETLLFPNGVISQPNGLALDYDTDTLYLIDAQLDIIARSRLDGSDYTVLHNIINSTLTRIYGQHMDFFQGKLYFGDRFEDTVYSFDVNAEEKHLVAVAELKRDPGNVRVVHSSRQPTGNNPCGINNGGCSHLCVLSSFESIGYSCLCPDEVDPDKCSGPMTTELPTPSATPDGRSFDTTTDGRPTSKLLPGTCSVNPCPRNTICTDQPENQGGVICTCPVGFEGSTCALSGTEGVSNPAGFVVSGTVFISIAGGLLAVILILTLVIALVVFLAVKYKYKARSDKRDSIAGMTDSSPRDSPTHVVVGRLSEHDYISIKSRDSPAPRGIVINIEGRNNNPNLYTFHKGTLPSTLVTQNGVHATTSNENTLSLPNGTIHSVSSGYKDILSDNETDRTGETNSTRTSGYRDVLSDSDDFEFNTLESRVDEV